MAGARGVQAGIDTDEEDARPPAQARR